MALISTEFYFGAVQFFFLSNENRKIFLVDFVDEKWINIYKYLNIFQEHSVF